METSDTCPDGDIVNKPLAHMGLKQGGVAAEAVWEAWCSQACNEPDSCCQAEQEITALPLAQYQMALCLSLSGNKRLFSDPLTHSQ